MGFALGIPCFQKIATEWFGNGLVSFGGSERLEIREVSTWNGLKGKTKGGGYRLSTGTKQL